VEGKLTHVEKRKKGGDLSHYDAFYLVGRKGGPPSSIDDERKKKALLSVGDPQGKKGKKERE